MEDLVKLIFNNFFRGKHILLTGHTGFKGSWLTVWLNMLGAKVYGYALEPETIPSLFKILSLDEKVEQCISDIRNYDSLLDFINYCKPEIVFHLAAQPLVRRSYIEPKLTYDTNIGGTVNLLEALKTAGCSKVIIVVTTDKVYENKEWVWGYRENDPLGGYDPYGTSKACSEFISKSYYTAFFKQQGQSILSTVRSGNVIGGGDWAEDRIVPDCISALKDGKDILVRNPLSIRPWQHVLEPLYGYLTLAAQMWDKGDVLSGSWNFGPDLTNTCTVQQLVELIVSDWGDGNWRTFSGESQLHETGVLKLNCERSKSYLGWQPIYDYTESIKTTVDWYYYYYSNGKEIVDFTKKQIETYMKKLHNCKII